MSSAQARVMPALRGQLQEPAPAAACSVGPWLESLGLGSKRELLTSYAPDAETTADAAFLEFAQDGDEYADEMLEAEELTEDEAARLKGALREVVAASEPEAETPPWGKLRARLAVPEEVRLRTVGCLGAWAEPHRAGIAAGGRRAGAAEGPGAAELRPGLRGAGGTLTGNARQDNELEALRARLATFEAPPPA